MPWIIIEAHGGPEYAAIVTDNDGNNIVYDTYDEACEDSKECQYPIVIGIGKQ